MLAFKSVTISPRCRLPRKEVRSSVGAASRLIMMILRCAGVHNVSRLHSQLLQLSVDSIGYMLPSAPVLCHPPFETARMLVHAAVSVPPRFEARLPTVLGLYYSI